MDQRRQSLVEEHLPLVEQVVLRISSGFPRFVDRSELVAAGMLGLVEAARRYDFDRSVPFAGFAVQRIRGAVLDVARSADWAPRGVRQFARTAEETSQELATRLRGRPDDDQLADAMGMTVAELRRLREQVDHGVTRALGGGGDLDAADDDDRLWDRSEPTTEELLESAELRGYLRSALQTLPERHRLIVIGLYLEGRSFEELADLLAVTPSRISQLRSDAIEMLREGIETQYRAISAGRPKGRVEIRKARYAADIARYADWRTRLTPSGMELPSTTGPAVVDVVPAATGTDGPRPAPTVG